jgi:hypothetical protein
VELAGQFLASSSNLVALKVLLEEIETVVDSFLWNVVRLEAQEPHQAQFCRLSTVLCWA